MKRSMDLRFLEHIACLARENVLSNRGEPLGAVVVLEDQIVGQGANRVTVLCDPTAHAEIEAMRQAAIKLGRFDLRGCLLDMNINPYPMCLTAAYWARIKRTVCGGPNTLTEKAGFKGTYLWNEIRHPLEVRSLKVEQIDLAVCREPLLFWKRLQRKIPY